MFGPCRGCAAKDQEIDRLVIRNTELLNRLLVRAGEAPLPAALAAPVDDHPRYCPACGTETGKIGIVECSNVWHREEPAIILTREQVDQQAADRLAKLAEHRGLDVREFADA